MSKATTWVCDARRGVGGPFSAPTGCPDYATWLTVRYRASQGTEQDGRPINRGTAQAAHAALEHATKGGRVLVIGEDADACADFLCDLAGRPRDAAHYALTIEAHTG